MYSHLVALSLCSFLDAADSSFFKGVLRALEVDLGFRLKDFVVMQMFMSGASMVFGPMWAVFLGQELLSQKAVLAATSMGWGITSVSLGAFADSVGWIISFRFVNIIFLCSALPVGQYIVSSHVRPEMRGSVFSIVGIFASLGVITSTKVSTTVSELTIFGMAGWRFGLVCIGIASIVFSAVTMCALRDDTADWETRAISRSQGGAGGTSLGQILAGVRQDLRDFSQIRSFWDIALFCSLYSVVSNAMMYSAMWLQYRGLSNSAVGTLMAWESTGSMLGHWVAGFVSDYIAKRYPLKGRLYVGQTCCLSVIPVAAILFHLNPAASGSVVPAGVLLAMLGFFESGWGVGCNRVILSIVVPKRQSSSLMAWKGVLEHLVATLVAPPLVAWIAATRGYQSSELPISQMSQAQVESNAKALSGMLAGCVVVAHAGMFLVYCMMHRHLEKDMDDLQARLKDHRDTEEQNDASQGYATIDAYSKSRYS